MLEDFDASREELDNLRSQVSTKINELEQSNAERWNDIANSIKSLFSEIQMNTEDFMNNIENLEQLEQEEARKYYQTLNADVQKLETRFNEIQSNGPTNVNTENDTQKETPQDVIPYQMPQDPEPPKPQLAQENSLTEPLNPLEAGIETNDIDEENLGFFHNKKKVILIGLMIFFMIVAAFCFIYFALL